MGEGVSIVESIERPLSSRYFSRRFVEEAPSDRGADKLLSWLDNKMHLAIGQQVEAPRKFHPAQENVPPLILEDLDDLYKNKANAISQVLIRYAENLHSLAKLNDPETKDRENKMREALPKFYKNRPPLTKKRLLDRQVPLLEMINAFQLQPKKK